jgi:hypothetical protein
MSCRQDRQGPGPEDRRLGEKQCGDDQVADKTDCADGRSERLVLGPRHVDEWKDRERAHGDAADDGQRHQVLAAGRWRVEQT